MLKILPKIIAYIVKLMMLPQTATINKYCYNNKITKTTTTNK